MNVTQILDGPAAGRTFATRRAPMYVRVVRDRRSRTWDILDQLDDAPRESEDVFVYAAVPKTLAIVFVRPGGRFEGARYRVVEGELPDFRLVDREAWREWARAQPAIPMLSDAMRDAIAQARAVQGRLA